MSFRTPECALFAVQDESRSELVAVVGPGALGCLFAARLALSAQEVILVDHDTARAQRLAASGITLEDSQGVHRVPIQTATAVPERVALTIILTKAQDTPSILLPPQTPVLTFQNGLGNAEILSAQVGEEWVIAGSTTEASTLLGEGHLRHAARGLTRLGPWTHCPLGPALATLQSAGFSVEACANPRQILWEKAVVSAGLNPLTALLNVPNGALVAHEESRSLLSDLVSEASSVAAAEGFPFAGGAVEAAERVCTATGKNISSMLQDIRAGRGTEIEAISGELLRRGERHGISLPATRMVYHLIRGLEHR